MGFGGPKAPPPPAMPPPSAHPPVLGSSTVNSELAAQKALAAGAANADNTVATSPQGLVAKPNTANATLLGQ